MTVSAPAKMQLTPNTRRLDRMLNGVEHRISTTRSVGPASVTVCSPASRRVAARRPRYAGLRPLTPAPRTVTGNLARQPENHSSRKEERTN